MSERKVLIIGGGGYVGTAVTPLFLEAGFSVRCLDSFVYGHDRTVFGFLGQPGYEFMRGDLCDADTVRAALSDVDDVILLAGLVGDPITKTYPDASKAINDDGYRTVFDVLAESTVDRVIFVSTCSNYGLIPEGAVADENWPLNPLSLYAKAKVAAELYLMEAAATLPYVPTILRFATAFGLSPRMRFDLTVSEFTRELAIGNELIVFDADTWRPYCHVRDFGRLLLKTLAAPKSIVHGTVFNAGGDTNNATKRSLVEAIAARIPGAHITYEEHGGDPRNYRVNFAKVRSELEFEPAFSIDDGIDELMAALNQGFFKDVNRAESLFGNWVLK